MHGRDGKLVLYLYFFNFVIFVGHIFKMFCIYATNSDGNYCLNIYPNCQVPSSTIKIMRRIKNYFKNKILFISLISSNVQPTHKF
jgi:hypothetical protein